MGAPLGLVLEGGYAVDALAASMAAVVPVLGSAAVPSAVAIKRHPLAVAAIQRLKPWWGEMGA